MPLPQISSLKTKLVHRHNRVDHAPRIALNKSSHNTCRPRPPRQWRTWFPAVPAHHSACDYTQGALRDSVPLTPHPCGPELVRPALPKPARSLPVLNESALCIFQAPPASCSALHFRRQIANLDADILHAVFLV